MLNGLRVGIIGCSGIAIAHSSQNTSPVRMAQPHSHAAAYAVVPTTTVTAICDVSEEALARYSELWGPVAAYTDYKQMLEAEQLDLLSIVTPDHLHADIFVSACDAGVKGVFCEKPIATTLEDADRMIAAAERSGVKVIVNHTRRFDPFYRHARWLIEQDTIGPLRVIHGTLGGERAMLFRNGTHVIDTMLFFAGSPPSRVIAELDEIDAGYGPAYRGDGGHAPESEPGATALITFENGIRAVYTGSKQTVTNLEIDLQGTHGRIRIGNQVAELSTITSAGGLATQPLPLTTDLTSGMVVAVNELIDLVENDGDGVAALHSARSTLDVLLGILRSADQQAQSVTFPQQSLAIPATG